MNETMPKCRTAIITWISYLNFGTFLQAYALQNILRILGFPNNIISDRQLVYPDKPDVMLNLKQIMVNFLHPRKVWLENLRKARRYKSFEQKFLSIDYGWNSTDELTSRYDTFVCGSDQIWSPILPDHYDGFYFASFVKSDKVQIAYAPSLGLKGMIPTDYQNLVRPWLKNFTAISLREKSGTEIIRKITGREDIETVLDPTLLLTSEQWRKLENNNRPNEIRKRKPYMLAYFLTFNKVYLMRAYELAHKKGLKLVCINTSRVLHGYYDELVVGVGPMDFLSLIANSEYVFTDSFHGTIFSIQFHKPCITVKRFSEESNNNQNSRIENLFNILGLEDNLLSEETIEMEPEVPDWEKIELVLGKERESSLLFLKKALNN